MSEEGDNAVGAVLGDFGSSFFRIQDAKFQMSLSDFNLAAAFTEGATLSYVLMCEATIIIGGDGGFETYVHGEIGLLSGTSTLTVSHEGGWSPFDGPLAEIFQTPSFVGEVIMTTSDVFISLHCHASYIEAITIVPGVISMEAHPDTNATGSELTIALTLESLNATANYTIYMSGGFQLGSGRYAPPIIGAQGLISKYGTSWLVVETQDEWTPLPLLTIASLQGEPPQTRQESLPHLCALTVARVGARQALSSSKLMARRPPKWRAPWQSGPSCRACSRPQTSTRW